MLSIFHLAHTSSSVCRLKKRNYIANSADNGDRKIALGSLDGGEDGEHNGDSFVEIPKTSTMHDIVFVRTKNI